MTETRSYLRLVRTTSGLFLLVAFAISLKDVFDLEPREELSYCTGRIAFFAFMGYHFLRSFRGKASPFFPYYIYVAAMFYTVQGQWYEPNYWLAFIELNLIFTALFSIPRRHFIAMYAASVIPFNAVLLYRAPHFIAEHGMPPGLVRDVVIGTIITQLISVYYYNGIISLRYKTEELNRRFTDLGKNLSFILHDIKGMVSTHLMFSQHLAEMARRYRLTEEEEEAVRFLAEDKSLLHFVSQVNSLIRSELNSEAGSARVSESFNLIKSIFGARLKGVNFHLDCDIELRTRPYVINRILINAIKNALDEFCKKNVSNGEIRVTCGPNSLLVEDNAGVPVDPEIIKCLNRPLLSKSTKEEGSGLGTYVIKEYVEMLGGQVRFLNGAKGMRVEMEFPEAAIVK